MSSTLLPPGRPGAAIPRGRLVVVIIVVITVLAYGPILIAAGFPPELVAPTAVAIGVLAVRVARSAVALISSRVTPADTV